MVKQLSKRSSVRRETARHPFELLRQNFPDIWGMFPEGDWGLPGFSGGFPGKVPELDISESPNCVEVKADLPGMKSDQIEVQLNGHLLTISGERKEEQEQKEQNYHRVERRTGYFSRSVSLPCDVEEEGISARYEDGVLTVVLPKSEHARSRKISVKGG